jgi:prolyl oligopeptidase
MEFTGTGRTTRRAVIGGIAAGALTAIGAAGRQAAATSTASGTNVPAAPSDHTSYDLHGVTIADPYRPLEDSSRADVKAWIEAEDARARTFLDSLATRNKVRDFFMTALNYSRTTIPARHGQRYFTLFSEGLANQRSLGVQDNLAGPRRTLIDATTPSTDGTVTIAGTFPDRLGTKVAYLLSEAGSDRETLHIQDTETGQDLSDVLAWCKHTSVAWSQDGRSFFYSRYPGDDDPADWYRRGQILSQHRLGEPQSADRPIFRLRGRAISIFRSGLRQKRAC